MYTEQYDIFDTIKFELTNRLSTGILEKINPEYEYFASNINNPLDFKIIVTNQSTNYFSNSQFSAMKIFKKQYRSWAVKISEYENGCLQLEIMPKLTGIRKIVQFTALKNIYVRSLLNYKLIQKGYTLIHAAAVNINNKAIVFAGRPGVFKTSILMDSLRYKNAIFLGEENVMLKNGLIYPFPLNIRSINWKMKYYKNEEAPSKIHKYLLALSLLRKSNNNLTISKPIKLHKLYYLERKDKFDISDSDTDFTIDKLCQNELKEFSLPPTHTFSGIKNNYFIDYLNKLNEVKNVSKKLNNIFSNELHNVELFYVQVPFKYRSDFVDKLLEDE